MLTKLSLIPYSLDWLECPKVFYRFGLYLLTTMSAKTIVKGYRVFIDNCLNYSEKNRTFLTMKQIFRI
jgi:hypothetical protein